jgi:NADPH:quinone reductase-like Zn-dependent oxidoreductase
MRAVRVREHGAPETARVEELPSPAIGDDQVLIDVKAIGVNYPDFLVIGGTYQILRPRPCSPGKDAAGIVRAVGRNASHCKPGDRVAVHLEYRAYWVRCVQTELFALYEKGAVRPRVMRTFPLERFAEALALVRDGRVQGKVVLTTAPERG